MAYYPTTQDLDLLKCRVKEYKYRFELLDEKNILMDLEADVIDGSFKISADSDVRRTLDVNFCIKSQSNVKKQLCLGRYLRVYMGQMDFSSNEYVWYLLGLFTFNNTSYTYDEATNTLSLSCSDLMSLIVNGQIRNALNLVIEEGIDIRTAMAEYVRDCGVNDFVIDEIYPFYDTSKNTVPYEMRYSVGSSTHEPIKELRDLYPGWETYFDEDVFVCKRTPTCKDDNVAINSQTFNPLVKSENGTTNLDDVKNITEVWGKCFEVEFYSEDCILNGNAYDVTFNGFSGLVTDMYIGVKVSAKNPSGCKMRINEGEVLDVLQYTYNGDKQSEDPLEKGRLQPDSTYVFRYKNGKMFYCGQYQVHAITALVGGEPSEFQKTNNASKWNCNNIHYVVNPSSPYTVDKIGDRWNVLSGGEYDKIYTDDDAKERADYENWLTCRLNDGLTLQTLTVPWLDVNQKVEYTTRQDGETGVYITKSISFDFSSGTMSVELMRFYEDWYYIIGGYGIDMTYKKQVIISRDEPKGENVQDVGDIWVNVLDEENSIYDVYVKIDDDNYKRLVQVVNRESPVMTGSFSQNRMGGSVVGDYSHTEGYECIASNRCSHAEGNETQANGAFSHAEGFSNKSNGTYSHSEGGSNEANGDFSHAEGNRTKTNGHFSHAEGCGSVANGVYSHAEGYETQANSNHSHAEGSGTLAGAFSHAEGVATVADNNSHAEGNGTKATGFYSHAEGNGTEADNHSAHAEGNNTHAGYICHAEGEGTVASNSRSHAEGWYSKAIGYVSHAEGISTEATGYASHAEGECSEATYNCAHAEGYYTEASDYAAHAEGYQTKASGVYGSHSEGMYTEANGYYSHAEGCSTKASGRGSHSGGDGSEASGSASFAHGNNVIANKDGQVVFGFYNQDSDGAFIIGNGARTETGDVDRSNLFRIANNGEGIYGYGPYNTTGADYAEYIFEWEDGNIGNEDRVGYFVTTKGKKLLKAGEGDYIIGVTSATPSVVGNGDVDWMKRYQRDEFGRIITKEVEEPIKNYDEDGKEMEAVEFVKRTVFVQNSDYDPNQEYIDRKRRPEWDYVGMRGVVRIRDDGTCEIDGYCKCGKGGIATKSKLNRFSPKENFKVLDRVSENVIMIDVY